MRGFYWGRGVVHCGFCGMAHHNITTCKSVDTVASSALHKIEVIPDYELLRHEKKALHEMKRREERKALKTKKKQKKRAPRCSFCKSLNHKRPKCDSLKEFRHMVYKANKNWKRLFAQRINECGLGIGCLIEMNSDFVKNLMDEQSPEIGMITGFNIKDLNVFCSLTEYSNYQSNSTFQVMVADKIENISVKFLSTTLKSDLLARGWWYDEPPPKVLNPMPWTPDPEWLDSEWDEVMNWFFNDITKPDLISSGTMQFIKGWAEKF